jgi:hypothetical protein
VKRNLGFVTKGYEQITAHGPTGGEPLQGALDLRLSGKLREYGFDAVLGLGLRAPLNGQRLYGRAIRAFQAHPAAQTRDWVD